MNAMRILVLLGGDSAERDVSFATGGAVARALASRGHALTGVDPAAGRWFTQAELLDVKDRIQKKPPALPNSGDSAARVAAALADPRVGQFDVAFLALHGGLGENGTVQTLLGLAGVPYTGSGPLASGVAMHKDTAKRLFRQAAVPTPDWLFPADAESRPVERLGLPLIVKPVAEGSTVGLTLLKDPSHLEAALRHAGPEPLCERFIAGRELSVGVLGDRVLPPVEIVPQHEIYDYECKYTDGKAEFICPAPLDAAVAEHLGDLALAAFKALGCAGYARVDFRLSPQNEPFCLEVNTLPGMTSHSLVPLAAGRARIGFEALCEEICRLALTRVPR
jgi:D-alanine-D-alanine ligase